VDGFTLVEALVALALIGLGLLLDLGLQAQSRELEQYLGAEADLVRRAEAAIESVRAGVHPLRSGPVDPALAWPSAADPPVAMILVVDPSDVDGLCRLMVRGQSRSARGRPHDVTLETLVWRPGAACE
jgi:prepilin-type N-terminal cleavage/methylation domain-containing protein